MTRLLLGHAQFYVFQPGGSRACVLGAANGQVVLGVAAVMLVVPVHLGLNRHRTTDLALTAVALLVGLAWDTRMLRGGWAVYAAPDPLAG